MDAKAKFELVKWFFERTRAKKLSERGYQKRTGIGLFVPSDLTLIKDGIERVIGEGIIDPNGWIIDEGFGDGGVVSIASFVYGVPALGLEYDRELFDIGRSNIEALREIPVLEGGPIRIARGNFLRDSAYEKLWIDFQDIPTIFNFQDNYFSLATRIASQSRKGTVFLFEHCGLPAHRYEGLKFEQTLTLTNGQGLTRYISVYRK